MTIIKPFPAREYIRFLALIFSVVLLGGLIYIFTYNALVGARFELKNLKAQLIKNEALNIDLKNNLYALLDPKNLEALAATNNLVLERKPDYLSSN